MSVNLKKANNLVVSYPKEPTKFLTFFALTSKKFQRVVKTKDKSTKMIIWCHLTQQNTFIFMIWPLLEAWAKKCEKFCWFFGVWEDKIICFRNLLTFNFRCQELYPVKSHVNTNKYSASYSVRTHCMLWGKDRGDVQRAKVNILLLTVY